MRKPKLITISERSIFQRMYRVLIKEGYTLKKCSKRELFYPAVGDYYVVDNQLNVVDRHIQLEEYAKELGIVKSYEHMKEKIEFIVMMIHHEMGAEYLESVDIDYIKKIIWRADGGEDELELVLDHPDIIALENGKYGLTNPEKYRA